MNWNQRMRWMGLLLTLVIAIVSFSCDKEETVELNIKLGISENSIPDDDLSAEGGDVSLKVEWAFTEWEVEIGEVVEGEAFIDKITPETGGDVDQNLSLTTIRIHYKANTKLSGNSQKIIVRSTTGDGTYTQILTQKAMAIPVKLEVVQTTIPDDLLDVNGGTFTFDVHWAYTDWEIEITEAIEGSAFITAVTPASGGDVDSDSTLTSIELSYKANPGDVQNRQSIVIRSLSEDLSYTQEFIQSAKGYEQTGLTVNPGVTYQNISGFGGAAHMWIYGVFKFLTDAEMEAIFSKENGLGLSIYRVRLSSVKSDWASWVSTIKKANEMGVTVLATPWSPPAIWKSNDSTDGGGHLKQENYDEWIGYINEFIQYMSSNGAKIDVVSLQNEPDWLAPYEGCEYTPSQMLNLVKNYSGGIVGAKVLAAESLNSNHAFTDPILNDPTAVNNLDIVGGHLYGSGLQPYPLAAEKGKEVWMTEHLYNLDSGNNPDNWTAFTSDEEIWAETMLMLQDIQQCMQYNWNAYIWWSIKRFYSFMGDGVNGTTESDILKRGYAFSQFSKFIRPGYTRIATQLEHPANGLVVTAYEGDGNTVVVILNPGERAIGGITITGASSASSAFAYTTSLNKNFLEKELSPANGAVTVSVEANSIKTVVFN